MILNSPLQIAYVPVPKNGCSTLKHLLYEVEVGTEFGDESPDRNIHNWRSDYRTLLLDDADLGAPPGYAKIVVLREPVARFVSSFRNRVLYKSETDTSEVAGAGLNPRPDIDEFVAHLAEYRRLSPSIRHHTDLQVEFVGSDLSRYDEIFDIAEMQRLELFLRSRLPSAPALKHLKKSGSTIELSMTSRSTLDDLLAPDIELYESMRLGATAFGLR